MPSIRKPPTSTVDPPAGYVTRRRTCRRPSPRAPVVLGVLEHYREGLTDADADGGYPPTVAGLGEPGGERAEDAPAGRAERVADRDGAALGVDDLRVDLPGVHA